LQSIINDIKLSTAHTIYHEYQYVNTRYLRGIIDLKFRVKGGNKNKNGYVLFLSLPLDLYGRKNHPKLTILRVLKM